MEKVIVTGGAGFIGSHIVDNLLEQGYEVHVIDNLSGGKKENVNSKAVLHIVDIRDKSLILPIFEGAKYVFHEAALPRVQYSIANPIETNDVNVIGLLNVLEASREKKVKRVIYAASSSAYGNSEVLPLSESFRPSPLSPYGAQKYIGEVYCEVWAKVYGLETVSLRYFNVYGPRLNLEGAYPLVIGLFLKQSIEDKNLTITGDGNQTRDFTHVYDVVKANILAMKSSNVGSGEVINIGSSKNISINFLAGLFNRKIEYIPERLEPKHTLADRALAKKLLDWEPSMDFVESVNLLKKEFNIQ